MTFEGDPYRTLGVEPGASVNEIRSAYRRLAKKYHPDAAGERALPRFLAIQAAYERLVDGEGRLRPVDWGRPGGTRRGGGGGPTSPGSGGDPWRADPTRDRASRDAWRARRSGATGGPASGAAAAGPPAAESPDSAGEPGAPGSAGAGAQGSAGAGSSGAPGSRSRQGAGRPGSERHHARRGPRKATPGSTSYDEAAENPLDPEWDGGAWYGPSSGTYWTLNPREYADPRKHGPEYLARARRAAAGGPDDARPGAGPSSATAHDADPRTDAAPDAGEWQWTGAAHTTTDGGAAEWGARGWSFETGEGGASWTRGPEARGGRAGDRPLDREANRGRGRPGAAAPPDSEAAPLPDLEALVRQAFPEHLLALALRDWRWRLLLALVAWPPIGYAIGGTVSAATGCSRYAVSCPDAVPVGLLLLQPLILAAVYALPRVTAVAAFASIAALAVAIPVGAVLSVGALPKPQVEPLLLGVVVGATYLVALVAAALRLRVRDRPPGAGP